MKLREITSVIEEFAPLSLQADYDNAGLITGHPELEITGAVLCLDVTEAVLDEAIARKANLVISHHPIVFLALKSITGRNHIERCIIKAIQHNIAIYAAHTNLDSARGGVSFVMAEKLGLQNVEVLEPRANNLVKIGVHTPESHAEAVRAAMTEAGAGAIGDYDSCTFNVSGEGTFRAKPGAQPYVGQIDQLHREPEIRTESVVPTYRVAAVVTAIRKVHPYEEIAYDITPLNLPNRDAGYGAVGDLPEPVDALQFLQTVKETFAVGAIRHSDPPQPTVRRVAMIGGSGSDGMPVAIAAGADVFLTGDIKYNSFFDARNHILLADIGHFESEIGVISLLYELLTKKFPTFALHKSDSAHNPVNYL